MRALSLAQSDNKVHSIELAHIAEMNHMPENERKRMFDSKTTQARVRVNTIIVGEPAEWLKSWKSRGIVTSYTDAILQALRSFHREMTDNELKIAQLQNIKAIEGEQP